jgi:hypothetical protein
MGDKDGGVTALSIRPADYAAPVGVPAGTVVMVTSVKRLKAISSTFAAYVEAPTPDTIMRLGPRKGP